MKRLIYTTSSSDDFHIDQLKVFLCSLYENGGHWPIVIDIIDGTKNIDEDLFKINSDIYKINYVNYDIVNIKENQRFNIPIYNLNVMWSRPIGLVKILDSDVEQVISIDTDIIIRKNISKIWDNLDPGTIKWFYRPNKKSIGVRVQGGLIAFGNSDKIKKYYREVLKRCGDSKSPFVMQESLYNVWIEMKLKMIDIGRSYNDDGEFNDKSRVWHCKHSHYEDKKWKKEFSKYISLVKEKLK